MFERKIGGLAPLEYCVLQVRCEKGQRQQTPPILGRGRSATHRQVPRVQIDHGMGTLERADQHRVLRAVANRRGLDLGPPAAIADADRGDEPEAVSIGRIILEPLVVGQAPLNTGALRSRQGQVDGASMDFDAPRQSEGQFPRLLL